VLAEAWVMIMRQVVREFIVDHARPAFIAIT
jgi:hypothetical protein